MEFLFKCSMLSMLEIGTSKNSDTCVIMETGINLMSYFKDFPEQQYLQFLMLTYPIRSFGLKECD